MIVLRRQIVKPFILTKDQEKGISSGLTTVKFTNGFVEDGSSYLSQLYFRCEFDCW